MVGQGGQKDSHHSLSINRSLPNHPLHKIAEYYHNYHLYQYQWDYYSLPLLQTLTILFSERPLGGSNDANM